MRLRSREDSRMALVLEEAEERLEGFKCRLSDSELRRLVLPRAMPEDMRELVFEHLRVLNRRKPDTPPAHH